jgi:acetyltransferase
MVTTGDIGAFFEPRSVAVIGSLNEAFGLGYVAVKNLLQFGYGGKVYPVNPAYGDVLGMRTYAEVGDIGEPVDTAILMTPPETVPRIVSQCAASGVGTAVVVSDGFAEASENGGRLQRELTHLSRDTGIRIIGPNTIGLLNTANGYITVPYSIAYERIRKGGITFCSQSGFVGPTAQPLQDRALPIAKTCDLGNKCDVDEADLLDYLADDEETSVVAMHLEDVRDGRRFMEVSRRLAARKPLLVLKPGRSAEGARASASHTHSLAGNEQVYGGAFRQAGVIRVSGWHDFWELPRMLAYQQPPAGNRIGIITHTGGAGVVAVDAAVDAGLAIATFSDATNDRLTALYPRLAGNPVDMGPALSVVKEPFYVQEEALVAVLEDPGVDCVAIAVYHGFDFLLPIYREMFGRLKERTSKPMAIWAYGMQLPVMEDMARQFEEMGLPTYFDFETAIRALGAAARYAAIRAALAED